MKNIRSTAPDTPFVALCRHGMAWHGMVVQVLVRVFQGAFKVVPTTEMCECASKILCVTFNKKNSPLSDGTTELQGCMFCDPQLAELIAFEHCT